MNHGGERLPELLRPQFSEPLRLIALPSEGRQRREPQKNHEQNHPMTPSESRDRVRVCSKVPFLKRNNSCVTSSSCSKPVTSVIEVTLRDPSARRVCCTIS